MESPLKTVAPEKVVHPLKRPKSESAELSPEMKLVQEALFKHVG
jgi:carbon-monoxide dehydrogenase large subunit